MIPVQVLAHGALGWWDEIIFLSVVVLFLVLMGVSWFRSRTAKPEFEDRPDTPTEPQSPDRFRLD